MPSLSPTIADDLSNEEGCLHYLEGVSGAMRPEECRVLFRLAQGVTDGAIVEIGSYHGKSTLALAFGSRSGTHRPVYAIDPHELFTGVLGGQFSPADRTVFFRTMLEAGVTETVRLINLPSVCAAKAWEGEIGLLWIDGDHRYEAVRADYEHWSPFLRSDGYLVFDDSVRPDLGPSRLVEEILAGSEGYILKERVGKITVLCKAA